jgi:hypothetical protein
MRDAALMMFSASCSAAGWAMLGGIAWMLIFYWAIPLLSKWNSFGLLSAEAAQRSATLRAIAQHHPASERPMYWA